MRLVQGRARAHLSTKLLARSSLTWNASVLLTPLKMTSSGSLLGDSPLPTTKNFCPVAHRSLGKATLTGSFGLNFWLAVQQNGNFGVYYMQRWALLVFLNFFNNKNDFFLHFLSSWWPISAPVLFKKPTPSQIELIKNANIHFLLLKKFKNTESAQLWLYTFKLPMYIG